jgi:site-specific DNA recombinase
MISSIIIVRSSQDRHDVSCTSQDHEIREEALRRGEKIIKTLEYSAVTHSEFLEDPSFHELLAEVKSKDRGWSKIWFYDTSRVSRNRFKAQSLKAFLKNHGVIVEFLKLPKTGIEALDNVLEGILEAFDQMLSDFSKAGAIRGQKQNIRSGYRAGGRAPYGYRLKKHQVGVNRDNQGIFKTSLEPDPTAFPIVKEYLERRATGESRLSIFDEFKRRGIRSPSGGEVWYSSSGKAIEENVRVYQGCLVYNRHNERINKKRYKGGRKWRDPSEWEVRENCHSRCIDDDVASKIMRQLESNKQFRKNPGPKRHLLTDILYCGDCGHRMVGNSGFYACINKMRVKNTCSNSNIKIEYLDKQVLNHLKDNLITPKFYEKFISTIQEQLVEHKANLLRTQKSQTKRHDEIDRQIGNLMRLYSRGKIQAAIIEKSIEPLQKEKEEIEARSDELNQLDQILELKVEQYSDESIRGQLQRFEEMLNEDNLHEMRNMVRDFIHRIEIFPKEIPGAKKWKRRIHINGYVRALTMINVASPRGFEPLLPT